MPLSIVEIPVAGKEHLVYNVIMSPKPDNHKIIFLVEDDTFLSSILTARMSELYTIRSFATAEELLKALITDKPDLILLDIYLPGLNGLDALEQLRQHHDTAKLPVIVVSNTDDQKDRSRAMKLGAHFMIKAMTDPGDIMKKVNETLTTL